MHEDEGNRGHRPQYGNHPQDAAYDVAGHGSRIIVLTSGKRNTGAPIGLPYLFHSPASLYFDRPQASAIQSPGSLASCAAEFSFMPTTKGLIILLLASW